MGSERVEDGGDLEAETTERSTSVTRKHRVHAWSRREAPALVGEAVTKAQPDDLRVVVTHDDVSVVLEANSVAERGDERLADERLADERPAGAVSKPKHVADGNARRRYRALAIGHIANDVLCLNISLLATSLLDEIAAGQNFSELMWLAIVAAGSALWVGIFHAFGLYSSQHLSAPEELRRIIGATSVGAAVLIVSGAGRLPDGSHGRLGLAFGLVLLLELSSRLAWRRYARHLRKNGQLAYRTVVVGSHQEAAAVASALVAEGSGFVPVGRVADGHDRQHSTGVLPYLGEIGDLHQIVREWSADSLFVASSLSPHDLGLLRQISRRERLNLRLITRVPEMLSSRLTLQPIGSVTAVAVRPAELTETQAALKRAFDLSVASVALLISIPVQLLVGLSIRLTSPGPILFRQRRVTKDNRIFTVYKFRTMEVDAEQLMAESSVDTSQPFFKGGGSPPVTRVGGVLRKLSLDELPQLWNVIHGDMSLVGPRPLPADQVAANTELLGPRHEVRAGLTGWWQVNGRSDVSAEQAVQQDLFYIENWSLSLDLYIMLRTVGVLLLHRGAY